MDDKTRFDAIFYNYFFSLFPKAIESLLCRRVPYSNINFATILLESKDPTMCVLPTETKWYGGSSNRSNSNVTNSIRSIQDSTDTDINETSSTIPQPRSNQMLSLSNVNEANLFLAHANTLQTDPLGPTNDHSAVPSHPHVQSQSLTSERLAEILDYALDILSSRPLLQINQEDEDAYYGSNDLPAQFPKQ